MSNRYKVWSRGEDGKPKFLLMRFGTPRTAVDFDPSHDYGDFTGSPAEVAEIACIFARVVDIVLVKDFDTHRWYTVTPSGEVTEDTIPGEVVRRDVHDEYTLIEVSTDTMQHTHLETKCVGKCERPYRIDPMHPEYAKVKEALDRGDRSLIFCYHKLRWS